MSLALYRKYRPATFAEVKGQDHVTTPLSQALRNGKVHHAYLFSGPRGCGKTSSARILARSLNCAQGPTPEPCGVCDSCVALEPNGSGSLDVIEIDAASNNGVDDARDLRDRAHYAPVSSRFKVYIIDEAHMVTTAAFNALLKLVEEPPEFVKFIFATTEPEKVLQTIRSRTHHYPFRLMPRTELTTLLREVTDAEGVPVDPTVLPLVVRAAAGSARDGLSILDQVLASAGPEGVTREAAAALLGVTPDTLLDDVVDAFAARDAKAVFASVDDVMEKGQDPRRFATDVLERLRDLVILDAVPDAGSTGVLDVPAERLDHLARQAAQMGTAGLSRAADLFHDGLVEMRGTTAPRLLLELLCARVLLPAATSDLGSALARLERLERRLDITGDAVPTVPPHVPGPAHAEHPSTPHPGHHAPGARPEPGTAPGPTASRTPPPVPPAPVQSPAAAAPTAAPAAAAPTAAPAAAAPAAGVPAAWPTAATLGGAPAGVSPPAGPAGPAARAPGPAAAAGSPPPSSGEAPAAGLDAAALRRSWDAVLLAVKAQRKAAHAQLTTAQVLDLRGRALTLSFTHAPIMRAFLSSTGVDVLREALRTTLGADLDVTAVVGTDTAAAHEPSGAPSPARASSRDGFAPGDEVEPEDPDAPPPPPSAVNGEDAALRLVQSELGGRVLGTTGE